jgi:hypothetical protein
MVFAGVVKGIMFSVIGLDYHDFWLVAPAMSIAAVIGPIVLKRHLLKRFPLIDRWTA